MKTKVLTSLLVGGVFLSTACNAPRADKDTYMSGPEGATEEATAADRAETISVATDSSNVFILKDSVQQDSSGL